MKITTWLKRIGVRQLLTAFLAGILLFMGTACSALQAKTASEVREDLPKSAIDSPAVGGINVYPDTDPRKETNRISPKAKSLIDSAERRVNTKSIDNVRDLGENVREGAAEIPQKTRSATRDLSNEAVEAGKEVGRKTQRAAEDTSQNLKSGLNQAANQTQRAAENTSRNVQSGVNRATNSTQRALNDAADTID